MSRFKPTSLHQEQGFTLGEVMIAILIASLFVAASMQAMVVATVFKVRARQYAEATTWVQQDLETVKSQAAQLANDPLRCNATTAGMGFGKLLQDNLQTISGGDAKTIKGKTFTLTRTPTVRDVAPYDVLQLTYSVAQGTNLYIATIDTEVIPNAALRCP